MIDVLVLCGGLSPERDVSLRSGRRVAEALRDTGLSVDVADVDGDLVRRLQSDPPSVVLPMLHGSAGEDGSLADVITLLGLPYVGSAPDADRVAFDKPVAKAAARHWGLATPESVSLPHALFRELGAHVLLEHVTSRIGLPMVVKPAKGGSALGACVVTRAEDLPAALVAAYAYDANALIEEHIAGTEVAVTILDTDDGPAVLPAVEIVPDSGFYDYQSRYTAGMTEFYCPARLTSEQRETAAALAVRVHEGFALRDLSRVDMIIDDRGPWFLEVNVSPGMTETSLVPQALIAHGLDMGSALATLVRRARDRGPLPRAS